MNEGKCKHCRHFRQHYLIDNQSCASVNCGHCTYPRLKHRSPDTRACSYFELQTVPHALPDRDRVIHFLTTELLQFILSMELPPESKQGT